MEGFGINIESATLKNEFYRRVLFTVPKSMQLVVMSLQPGEEIGMEVHPKATQFIRVESGSGHAIIGKKTFRLKDGVSVIVPPRKRHNIINTSKTHPMKLYTIYTPPQHKSSTKQRNKPNSI